MANVPRSGSRRLRDSWPDSRRTFNTSNVWPRRRWNGWVTVAEPKERLASSAVRWVCGDAQPSLPAPWLWQPDAANIAGPIASLQQITAQPGDDGRGFRLRLFDRLSIRSRRSLVAHDVQQRSGQIGFGRCVFEQPTVGRAGVGTARPLAPRFLQQKASPLGCVRALILSAPRRAVGEHEAQLSWSLLSQSISSFAPLAFASLLALMRRSDFCVDVVPSSLPPSGLPHARTHADLPG